MSQSTTEPPAEIETRTKEEVVIEISTKDEDDIETRIEEDVHNRLMTENPTVVIKNTLDKLGKKRLKSFKFQLNNHKAKGLEPIARSKLEDKDAKDIATLMAEYYGREDALSVTRDILQKIDQRDLASQLASDNGTKQSDTSSAESEENTENSGSPSKTKRKKKKKRCLCFVNVKIHLPSCFD
ncbi:caspase b-like [Perca fluviatilis]|uniref:caspase b-like n=1 Tax=Perca fluviatilis TaxID=8168 RepID=UPI0019646029|nr:caspase b-like [Perca fluviatilis]